MIRSLYTGISGLRSHQTMMDVTGNNIANVNTTGYKTQNTIFEDTLSQTLANGTQPTGTRGGTNPAQVGLGVRVAGITTNFTQGSTQTTGRNTDMLIDGDGFFVSRVNGVDAYTRNGSFTLDASGTLTSSSGSGGVVQGWNAQNGQVNTTGPTTGLSIPVGTLIPPKATETLTMGGNLNALTPNGTTKTIPYKVYDTSGSPLDIDLTMTPSHRTAANPTAPVDEWKVSYTFNGGTPQVLGTAVFNSSGVLTGVVAAGASTQTPPTAAATGAAAQGTAVGATPPATGSSLVLTGLVGSNGVTIPDITLNVGNLKGTGSGSATADSTAKVESGDGYGAASLSSWGVAGDGTITGVFSNNQTQILGKVAVATFNNPAGLTKQGGSTYMASANSGAANIGAPAVDGRGKLVTGALEMSNVDLAQEFTNLIVSQRGFQANSRVITTSDQMLEELVNLKR